MINFYSPLRYPGGKNKIAAFIAKICIDNDINGHYIEPYSGGASVALYLLLEGFVQKITINDTAMKATRFRERSNCLCGFFCFRGINDGA